jgi:hypothetical protein
MLLSFGKVKAQELNVREYYDLQGKEVRANYAIRSEDDSTKEGYYTQYYDGIKIINGQYQNGKREGLWSFYFPDGRLHISVPYSNGKEEGSAKYYNQDGGLYAKLEYHEGKMIQSILYHSGDSTIVKRNEADTTSLAKSSQETSVLPVFLDGTVGMIRFIRRYYPGSACRPIRDKQLKIIKIRCIVDELGEISQPKIISDPDSCYDADILRLVSMMPPFRPALKDGLPVKVYLTIPIQIN